MKLQVRVDISAVKEALAGVEKQIPFAVTLGLNRLANIGQKAEQDHMRQAFKLRRETFVVRGVKINKADRATKATWRVTIQLAYPDARPFMDQHEQGGERTRHGGRYLWQPNQQVFKSKVISASNPLAPKNLHMGRTPAGQIKGEQRTFMVKTTNGERLVLQRERGKQKELAGGKAHGKKGLGKVRKRNTKGRAQTRVLYRLVSRVRIPADLRFVNTITAAVESQMDQAMGQAVRDALKWAR